MKKSFLAVLCLVIGGIIAFFAVRITQHGINQGSIGKKDPTSDITPATHQSFDLREKDVGISTLPAQESKGSDSAPSKAVFPRSSVTSAQVPTPVADEKSARRLSAAKSKVDKQYGGFLADLERRGGNAALFRKMLEERQMIGSDILEVARSQGINMANREASKPISDMIQSSLKNFSQEIRNAVGAETYRAFLDWEVKKPVVNLVAEFHARLEHAQMGLTAVQREQFERVLSESNEPNGLKRNIAWVDDGIPVSIRQVPESAIEQMGLILTQQQVAELVKLRNEQLRKTSVAGRAASGVK